MKRILIFFTIFTACLAADAQTVLKITDQGGQETFFGNVKDLKIAKTNDGRDTVSFKTMQVLNKAVSIKNVDVPTADTVYCPIGLIAKKVEIINETPIRLNKNYAELQLGLWAKRFSNDEDDQRDLRASVERKTLYATYKNGDRVKGMMWVSSDPTGVVVSADGEIHGYRDGEYKVYGYSPGGLCDSCTVWVKANTSKYNEDSEIHAHSFKTNDDDLKFFPLYVTEIGVYNKSKADKKSTLENTKYGIYDDYFINEQEMNDGAGGDYIYVGLKYDKKGEYITNPEGHYITDVKAIYTSTDYYPSPGSVIKIDGRNYQIAKSLSDDDNVDLTSGTDGEVNIFLAYTKDPYPRKDAWDNEYPNQKYLVSHTPDALLGGNGKLKGGWRSYTTNYFTNSTRIANGDSYGGDVDNIELNPLNKGFDDEVVWAIDQSGKYSDQYCDFNRGAGGDDIYMVCSYDEVYPPLDEWMKYVDDRTLISKLSLPATHDSGTESIGTKTISHTNSRTQELDIEEQFQMGIRSYDIRVTNDFEVMIDFSPRPTMAISHGPIHTEMKYQNVLDFVKKCLTEHPSEFIILRTKVENDEITSYVGQCVDNEVVMMEAQEEENATLGDMIIPFKEGLTLGECRGKIMIFNTSIGNERGSVRTETSKIDDGSFSASVLNGLMDGTSILTSQNKSDNCLNTIERWNTNVKQKEELWSSEQSQIHWFKKGYFWKEDIDYKFWRQSVFLSEFSKLPLTDHRWMAMNLNAFLWPNNSDPGSIAAAMFRMYIGVQAQYMNTYMADYISGLNGRSCGMVQMDFAGLNEACQDHDSNCEWCGIVNGYKLTQAVVRNNFKNKTFENGQYMNPGYGSYDEYTALRDIKLSTHVLNLGQSEEVKLSVSYSPYYTNDKNVRWDTSDPTVANIYEGSTVVAKKPGTCYIYVFSKGNEDIKDSCRVTVFQTTGYAHTGDAKIGQCHWVQLWDGGPRIATTDLGAGEEYLGVASFHDGAEVIGQKYTWGDNVPSTTNNIHKSVNRSETILTSDNDPVTQLWGPCWRMMTSEEGDILIRGDKVTREKITNDYGDVGYLITGKGSYSSNSIFLPIGDYWLNGTFVNEKNRKCYARMSTNQGCHYGSITDPDFIYFVRPVNVCEDIPITDIELDIPEVNIPIGGTVKVEAKVIPSNTSYSKKVFIGHNDKLNEPINDESIMGVNEGEGWITVQTSQGGFSKSYPVNVINADGADGNESWTQLWPDGPRFADADLEDINLTGLRRFTYGWGGTECGKWDTSYENEAPVIYYNKDPFLSNSHFGENWRMMTSSEADALIDNGEWTFIDGKYKISGKGAWSCQSIFLPVTGKLSKNGSDVSSTNDIVENGQTLYNYSAFWLSDTHQALVLSTDETGKVISKKIKTLDPTTGCYVRGVYLGSSHHVDPTPVESVNLHEGDMKNNNGDVVYVDTVHVYVGDYCRMDRAIVLPENASTKRLKWTVQDTSIATVSPILNTDTCAKVYGIKPGKTVLTARATDTSEASAPSDSIVVVVEESEPTRDSSSGN